MKSGCYSELQDFISQDIKYNTMYQVVAQLCCCHVVFISPVFPNSC